MNELPDDQAAEHESPASAAAPESSLPTEEELRAQFEEQVRKLRMDQVLLQSVVDILNLTARRLAKEDERDLEQGRLGIQGAQALIDLVPEEARADLRQAVSELQLLYAKQAGAPATGGDKQGPEPEGHDAAPRGPGADGGEKAGSDAGDGEGDEGGQRGPGLWTPPGS